MVCRSVSTLSWRSSSLALKIGRGYEESYATWSMCRAAVDADRWVSCSSQLGLCLAVMDYAAAPVRATGCEPSN